MFTEEKTDKEERSELLSLWVTPKAKKEFDMAGDNKTLQDKIIRDYIQTETDWLKQEMQSIDEATIKYRGKLITIKENFSEVQDKYVEEVEEIYKKADQTLSKLDKVTDKLETKVARAYSDVKQLNESISYINVDRLERMLGVVDRYNHMSSDEKELITLLLKK